MTSAEIADVYRKAASEGVESIPPQDWARLPTSDRALLLDFWDREMRQLAAWVGELEAVAARRSCREPGEEG